jgi:selenocysteine lyase/cysteine desulfurase
MLVRSILKRGMGISKLLPSAKFSVEMTSSTQEGKGNTKFVDYSEMSLSLSQDGRPLYFDNGATTALDPRVLDKMLPFMSGQYGNPHSKSH